jgi:hypothetical protein
MADDKGDEEPQKKKKMERQKCYFALHVSVAHFAPRTSQRSEKRLPP